ncbi:MAG TPA: hypothetical protein VFF02_00560 [Anaeromyxobacteraceae bacterium]|nr:hypothetical protein [Anaeromyxobacteraceae bacterium]
MEVPALQRPLGAADLDAWLLHDFRGQNPTDVAALDLCGQRLA